MTYTGTTAPLKLRVTPMQLPESLPVSGPGQLFAGIAGQDRLGQHGLLLNPGKPSELVVHLENHGRHPLQVSLKVEGDFPISWCYLALGGLPPGIMPIIFRLLKGSLSPAIQCLAAIRVLQQPEPAAHSMMPLTFRLLRGNTTDLALSLPCLAGVLFLRQAKVQDQVYLAPRRKTQAVLYFLAPRDVFEQADSIGPNGRLQIDYPGRIYIHGEALDRGRRHTELVHFMLHLRPHSQYLDYLPKLYREVDFVGRLLALFEQSFQPIIQTLDVMWANLDPLTAPEALLPFLAQWVAWPIDSRWSPTRQRRLIRRAVELYRWRGTRRGLQLFLHLYTDLPLDDTHIQIAEFEGRGFAFEEAVLGENTRLGGGKPFHFLVHLRPLPGQTVDKALVHHIIAQEKPAFCTYDLLIDP